MCFMQPKCSVQKSFLRSSGRRMLRVWVGVLFLLLCSPGSGADELLAADEIVRRAHKAAGGEEWVRPHTLYLLGNSTFFEGTSATHMDRHEMWRASESRKESAHQASGKVRIRSSQDGVTRLDLAFDGTTTYVNGVPSDEPSDSRRWASNFGFGVIRHALDPGYSLTRLPDDSVDGSPTFTIRVTDPQGGDTMFGIAQTDYAILKVAFDTPRGWHERIYSDFFSRPESNWKQPGLVRLYYNGIKQNAVRWTTFIVNDPAIIQFPSKGATE